MEKVIIVLDKLDYRKKEKELKAILDDNVDVTFFYTEYEDALIRKVCKWKYVGELLLHILYWWKSFVYALKIYAKERYGRIICVNPIVGIFLGMLNKKHKFEIILAGFLFEPKKSHFYYSLRKIVVKSFLKGITSVVVYAKKEVKYYENIFHIKKFRFVKYGIDYDAHEIYKGNTPPKYIFSGGRSNRDFHTLIEAFSKLKIKDISLCIATRPVVIQNENLENVIVLKDVVLETFGSAMEKSELVVLPLVETDISAGHQVLLEALERNMIVIVNRIEAVEDYVSDEQVIFYETGNVDDLKNKMEYVLQNYEQVKEKFIGNRNFYVNNYRFNDFIKRLITL